MKLEIGTHYGSWCVLKYTGKDKGRDTYQVQCKCGMIAIRRSARLVKRLREKGSVSCRSCAAKRRALRTANSKSPEYFLNKLYNQKRSAAEYAGHQWLLSELEFHNLINKNCHYCGYRPANVFKTYLKHSHSELLYQGIDRVDSSLEYVVDNCVPCCMQCNKAKLNFTVEEFLSWARRLAAYQEKY